MNKKIYIKVGPVKLNGTVKDFTKLAIVVGTTYVISKKLTT